MTCITGLSPLRHRFSRRSRCSFSRRKRAGLSLAETVVSMFVISVMVTAALGTVVAGRTSALYTSRSARGLELAQALMAEILATNYADGEYGLGSWGLGSDEVGDGSRALWEDVDDYDGWSASPPQAKDGSELTEFTGFGRTVLVEWVEADDLTSGVGYETGIKYVRVTVTFETQPVAVLEAIRVAEEPFGLHYDVKAAAEAAETG
jgi:hypothetical protein